MEVRKHEPGMFSWADLATSDRAGSARFYTQLLGLEATEIPIGGSAVYVILNKGGKSVCAIYEMSEETKQQTGGHPAWQSYFTVESADGTAARIQELGGSVLQEPFDVMDAGRMVVAQDPTGAVFAAWEPRNDIGSHVFGEPGALAWNELYTHDTNAATTFYAGLFGWSFNKRPIAVPLNSPNGSSGSNGDDYFEFHIDGRSAAGMMAIKKEWGEMPANWSIYFAVADLNATIEKAKGMGAKEVMPPMEVEDVGRFVFMQDPQAAYVAFIQLTRRQS